MTTAELLRGHLHGDTTCSETASAMARVCAPLHLRLIASMQAGRLRERHPEIIGRDFIGFLASATDAEILDLFENAEGT